MFKRKQQEIPAPETPIQEAPIGPGQTKKATEEVTLEQVIDNNPRSWYEARILEQLAGINEKLNKIIEENAQPPNK